MREDGRYSPKENYTLDVAIPAPFPFSDSMEEIKTCPTSPIPTTTATSIGLNEVGIGALVGDDDVEEEEFSIRIGLKEVDETSETSFSLGGLNIPQILTKSLDFKSATGSLAKN